MLALTCANLSPCSHVKRQELSELQLANQSKGMCLRSWRPSPLPSPPPSLLSPINAPCKRQLPTHTPFVFDAAVLGFVCTQALEKGAFKAGQRVLIQAGSGGVGSWLVQLAKSRGFHVTTTCSTPNIDFCKKVGAGTVRCAW